MPHASQAWGIFFGSSKEKPMLYVQRDARGQLIRVEEVPFTEMSGELASTDDEILAWRNQPGTKSSLLQLRQSDQEMIRVLEDLIQVLMDKGVVRLTDLPSAAQEKLMSRSQAREVLGGVSGLLGEEDGVI